MKLLRQKTSGELYVWDAELAKRDDMEDYVKPGVQSEPVQEEQAEIESETNPEEVVNEEEASVGSTEPEQAEQEVKPKSKSSSKGKR
jgi:hypothetical protein